MAPTGKRGNSGVRYGVEVMVALQLDRVEDPDSQQ